MKVVAKTEKECKRRLAEAERAAKKLVARRMRPRRRMKQGSEWRKLRAKRL
jgi:hypothetical protein